LVRVGGGYLHIDDFVKKYTPAEVEQVKRKNALKKFRRKFKIQKLAVEKQKEQQDQGQTSFK